MATSNYYCDDCETHFRATPEQHAKTYHDGGIFSGIEDGDWRDYLRRSKFKLK